MISRQSYKKRILPRTGSFLDDPKLLKKHGRVIAKIQEEGKKVQAALDACECNDDGTQRNPPLRG